MFSLIGRTVFLPAAVFSLPRFKMLINVPFIRVFYGITKEGNQKMKRLWSEYQLNSSLKELCSKTCFWLLHVVIFKIFPSSYRQLNLFAASLLRFIYRSHVSQYSTSPDSDKNFARLIFNLGFLLLFALSKRRENAGRKGISPNEIIILLTIIVTLNDAIIKFIISNYALSCAGEGAAW